MSIFHEKIDMSRERVDFIDMWWLEVLAPHALGLSTIGEIGVSGLGLLHVEEGQVTLVHVEAQRAGEVVDLEAIVEVGRGGIGSLVEVRALSGDGEELEAEVALVLEVGLAVELGAGRAQGARW